MAIVARAQITLTDSYDALSILLDNESHLIPTDANGTAFPNSYTGCAATVSIFQGTLDITSQYTITVPPVAGITGSLSGVTYTVTDMTLDDGAVVFTATHKTDAGAPVLTRHFSLSKNKRADSARFYQLRTSDNLIQRDGLTKELSPPNLLLAGYLREGEQAEISQSGYFIVYEQTRVAMTVEEYTALVQAAQAVPGEEYILSQLPFPYVERYRSTTALPFLDYAVQTDAMSIRVEWYADVDYTERLDVQTISVSSDGLTLYTWAMYADDNIGTGISAVPDGKRYVGFAENQTVSAPGNDPSVYTWSPLYDNVKVGAKNLVLLADKTKTTTAYLANSYTLTEKMIADEDYTLTLKGTLAPGQTGWNIYLNTTPTALTSLPYQAGSVIYTGHFNGKTLADTIHTLQVYNYPNNTSSATIEWIQLEKGNIATGFKVAPEDLALEFSQLDSAVTTLTDTTLPALEDGLLTKAEKTGIQTSADIVAAEKKDIDAAYNVLYSNENLVAKTVINTPKETYDTAYITLTTAIATVMNAPDGVALPDGSVTAARNALSAYADKLALLRTAMQTAQKTIEAQIQTESQNSLNTALQGYVDNVTYGTDKQALQNQVDKSITTWFGKVEPTMTNHPASTWPLATDKDVHLGDIYYNTLTGYAYRFLYSASIYSWTRITDSDIMLALANAETAQDTADGKRRVFVAQPVTPYDVGDLWTQGITGDLMRCKTAKSESGAYAMSDWEKASKYTDDTLASTANTAAQEAQTTANTAVTNAGLAQTAANAANTSIGDIVSDAKLTGNEKPEVRKEWNILVSAAILNSTQASAFGVSATAYQNAIAALGLYLNNNVAFTYDNATAGSIPSWISDTNLGTATTIVGATYRATWKTYYDAHVALMNAIATKAKALADAAQDTADKIQVGGRNLAKETIVLLSGATGSMRSYPLTVTAPDFSGKTVAISCDIEWTNKTAGTRLGAEIALSSAEGTVYVGVWHTPATSSSGKLRISNIISVPVRTYTEITSCASYIQLTATNTKVGNLKVEFANKPSDWTPAPEDVAADIAASNTNLNSLRQSMDNTKAIRLGMKIGYSSFSTVASGYLYLCGLQLNPTTFVEELADVNGSLYGSFYNSATGVVEPRVTIAVAKQAVNLNGVALGTTGYLIWDNTAKAIWFAHFIKTVGADGVVTAEYWNKRNVGKVGDNTELVLDASTYVIGELEI